MNYQEQDPLLWAAIARETKRQEQNIELIASENIVSEGVRAAQGSILTNKYAEGYLVQNMPMFSPILDPKLTKRLTGHF